MLFKLSLHVLLWIIINFPPQFELFLPQTFFCITFQFVLKIQNTWSMNHMWKRITPKWKQTNWIHQIPLRDLLDFVAKLCSSHMSLKGLSYHTLFVQINDARSSSFSIFEKTLCGMAPTPHYGMPRSCNNWGNLNMRIEVVWFAPHAEPPFKIMPLNHGFHPSLVNGLPFIPCLLNLVVTKISAFMVHVDFKP